MDGDLVAHFGHNAKIVRNEDGRGVELRLELSHELEHLRLNRHVERGCGLVGDEKLGAAGQGNGDDHALLHATGELVRILAASLGRNADELEHVARSFGGLVLAALIVEPDDLRNLLADGEHRVEARHRVLKDHRDALATDIAHGRVSDLQKRNVVKEDAAAEVFSLRRGEQTQNAERGARFSGACFSDEAEAFALFQRQIEPVDRVHVRVVRFIVDV